MKLLESILKDPYWKREYEARKKEGWEDSYFVDQVMMSCPW